MEKQIYNPMEKVLVSGALYLDALETKQKLNALLALDQLLLELEERHDMMDGLKMEVWL